MSLRDFDVSDIFDEILKLFQTPQDEAERSFEKEHIYGKILSPVIDSDIC